MDANIGCICLNAIRVAHPRYGSNTTQCPIIIKMIENTAQVATKTIKQQLQVFSTWMIFGGNTRDLGSFGEETDEITDLHQNLEEVLLIERGDGVTGIKRRCRDPSSDGIRDLVTASRRSRLNED
ncbi:hypothetical protein Tco_1432149 [Tanacetum coccineum]